MKYYFCLIRNFRNFIFALLNNALFFLWYCFSLIKEETQRPKYNKLLEHPFIRKAEEDTVDVSAYISGVLDNMVLRGLTPFTTNRH